MRSLERGLGLTGATATNMLGMIGVGPFLTLPIMLQAMGGPHILYAWLAGAGFATYLGYFVTLNSLQHSLVAAGVCLFMTLLLYRPTVSVARMSVAMLAVVILTVGWVIVAGLFSFSWAQAFDFPPQAYRWNGDLWSRIGAVSLLAMYNYGGYNNVCNLGDEIRTPWRTMPRAIVGSILLVVCLYLAISTVVLGTVPWQQAMASPTIASAFIEHTYTNPAHGQLAGKVMTGLILFVTAASLFSVILGYSRVPYAAAVDGQFFAVFSRVHPTGHFPHVSLLTLGCLSLPFCFFSLSKLVGWLILVQIVSQFIWQCAGVILLRSYRADVPQPFLMWFYPAPALLSLLLWLYVFVSAEWQGQIFALAFLGAGVVAFYAFERGRQHKLATRANEQVYNGNVFLAIGYSDLVLRQPYWVQEQLEGESEHARTIDWSCCRSWSPLGRPETHSARSQPTDSPGIAKSSWQTGLQRRHRAGCTQRQTRSGPRPQSAWPGPRPTQSGGRCP